jgi:hypothetical protein
MFTEMAYQWSKTRRSKSAPAPSVAPILPAGDAHDADEARIRAAMEEALERRRKQRR